MISSNKDQIRGNAKIVEISSNIFDKMNHPDKGLLICLHDFATFSYNVILVTLYSLVTLYPCNSLFSRTKY